MLRSPYPAGQFYRLAQRSGLITVVEAATSTLGQIFAFRWGDTSHVALVHRIRAEWQTITGFTAAQEIGLQIIRATAFTASCSGGTAATLTAPAFKKNTGGVATQLTDARIATTAGLTNGTTTIDAHALGFGGFTELAAGAAVYGGAFAVDCDFGEQFGGPLVLRQDQGLLVRNLILMGAAGTARVSVEVDWTEVPITADLRYA